MKLIAWLSRHWRQSIVWLVLACPAVALAQEPVTLQSLSFADLPGDRFEVRLDFSGQPPEASGFVLEDPARISIDLPLTRSALGQREFPVSSGAAESLLVLETSDRTRLVFNLREATSYETEMDGQSMIVRLGRDGDEAAPPPAAAPAVAAEPQPGEPAVSIDEEAMMAESMITDVNFRSGDERGEGLLTLELSDEGMQAQAQRSARRIEIVFPEASVPDRINRRFDVSDFATPARTVDVLPQQGNAAVLVETNEEFEYVAWQTGRQYNVSISPREQIAPGADPADQYSGTRVSLSFQDIDVRSVLQILADENELNLVASDAVSGTVTLQLQDVPWDQALDLVLRSGNLDSRLTGNVLYVAPAEEIAAQRQLALEAERQAERLEPLHTEYIQVNYADAGNILRLLTGSETAGGQAGQEGQIPDAQQRFPQQGQQLQQTQQTQQQGAGGGNDRSAGAGTGILSDRGTATVDPRTNIIIIRDVASKLEEVRELLAQLDVPVRQVLIEARIVNVSTDFGHDLGIRWGGAGHTGDSFHFGGSLEASTERQRGLAEGEGLEVTFPDALAVDLGAQRESASTLAFGFIRNSNLIELELSALESSGNGEVIARPQVTTQDQATANIRSGVRVPFQAQAGGTAGGSTTEFVDAVLSLEVTPQITPDGSIIMRLNIHQDSVSESNGQVPAINTNSVNTSLLVDDGDTVVLGGIFREETNTTETKTPLLGDMPYLGRLFSRSSTSTRRTELLIFITPRVIAELGGN